MGPLSPTLFFLIEAMTVPEDPKEQIYPLHAYQLQGPIRSTRQRPLPEVAYEVLNGMFLNNSTYEGKLPGRDQKAWQALWDKQKATIEFGKRAP